MKKETKRDLFIKSLENSVKRNFDKECYDGEGSLRTNMFFSISEVIDMYDSVFKKKSRRRKNERK